MEYISLQGICHLVSSLLRGPDEDPSHPHPGGDFSHAGASHQHAQEAEVSPILACLTVRSHGHAHRELQPGSAVSIQSASGAEELTQPQYIKALGLKLLLRYALGMLLGQVRPARDAAQRFLLPSCLHAASALGGPEAKLAVSAVWECCR
jgi:hypothetical protein